MKNYIGTKIIQAELTSMYNYKITKYGEKADCKEDDKNIEVYLVVYPPIGKDDKEYISMSPKEVFEKAYREIDPNEINLLNGSFDK